MLAALRREGDDPSSRAAIERAQRLYEKRKEYFHSIWGVVSSEMSATVGIQEWSHTSYDKFREVSVDEIQEFAIECQNTWPEIMKTALPCCDDAEAIAIDDEEGVAHPMTK